MSGGFDLTVIIEGRTMKEVALFVAEKLAPLENVLSTATHFVLKKFKDKGVIFEEKMKDDREAIIL
jgi:DNA-binding Lrp family transcriptional regulator